MSQQNRTRRNLLPHRSQRLRAAVLAAFTISEEELPLLLGAFTPKDWQTQLRWLDSSGLALYLLDRLQAAGMDHLLPLTTRVRLQQNRIDNTERNETLLAELAGISRAFDQEGVTFVHLKGITLTPESVPNPALRCQLDLDFLVATKHAATAARVLKRNGYARPCISGSTWEFKAGASVVAGMQDLYKTKPQRCAELHLDSSSGPLSRCHTRIVAGVNLPVLSPPDLFLAQTLHLFKHICSSFTRASWLLEFHRHLLVRSADEAFWLDLDHLIAEDPRTTLAIAVVAGLSAQIFHTTLPPFIQRLINGHLPASAVVWIEGYGLPYLLVSHPGSKLNLLLVDTLTDNSTSAHSGRRSVLLPLSLPPMITVGHQGETFLSQARRILIQVRFTCARFRFHAVEGVRYGIERPRFRRKLAGIIS